MTLLKYEPERTRGQRNNMLNMKKAAMVRCTCYSNRKKKNPDGDLRIYKGLKKPN